MIQRRYILRGTVLLLAALSLLTLPGLGSALPALSAPRTVTVRFEGEITAIAPSSWMIGGRSLLLGDETVIFEDTAAAEVGAWATVSATRAADGVLWADWIRVEVAAGEAGDLTEFTALIETFTDQRWVIGGVDVCITPQTTISGRPKLGLPAHVRARRMEHCWQAIEISVYRAMAEGQEVQFEGIVQAMGPALWVVSGLAVAVDEATVIVGEPAVGRTAEVTAVLGDNDRLWGEHIRVLPLIDESRAEFGGLISEMRSDGRGQQWTILRLDPGTVPGEEKVQISGYTLLDQSRALAAAGMWADVIARIGPDGELQAQHIRIERPTSAEIEGTLTTDSPSLTSWWQVDDQCVVVHSLTTLSVAPLTGVVVRVEGFWLGNGCIWAEQVVLL